MYICGECKCKVTYFKCNLNLPKNIKKKYIYVGLWDHKTIPKLLEFGLTIPKILEIWLTIPKILEIRTIIFYLCWVMGPQNF